MLSATLTNIENLLQLKTNLSYLCISNLISFLKNYRVNMWLYLGAIKRKLDLPISDIYRILQILQEEGYLESYYELYCSHCQKSSGVLIKYFSELPDTFECEICHEELSALENAILIYKVIKE
mgnify:CR=1 FL=1